LRSADGVTRIMVMSETLPLSSVKAHLSELVDRVEGEHDRVVVTRNGRPAAVLISHEDLEGLEETLAALSDPDLMRQIRQSEAAAAEGDVVSLDELRGRLGSNPRT
jgi:antitoxin YefM